MIPFIREKKDEKWGTEEDTQYPFTLSRGLSSSYVKKLVIFSRQSKTSVNKTNLKHDLHELQFYNRNTKLKEIIFKIDDFFDIKVYLKKIKGTYYSHSITLNFTDENSKIQQEVCTLRFSSLSKDILLSFDDKNAVCMPVFLQLNIPIEIKKSCDKLYEENSNKQYCIALQYITEKASLLFKNKDIKTIELITTLATEAREREHLLEKEKQQYENLFKKQLEMKKALEAKAKEIENVQNKNQELMREIEILKAKNKKVTQESPGCTIQ